MLLPGDNSESKSRRHHCQSMRIYFDTLPWCGPLGPGCGRSGSGGSASRPERKHLTPPPAGASSTTCQRRPLSRSCSLSAHPPRIPRTNFPLTVGKSVVLDLARPITRIVVGLGDYRRSSGDEPHTGAGQRQGTRRDHPDSLGYKRRPPVLQRHPSAPATSSSNDRLESLRRELRAELPGQPLKVSEEDGNIFLRGTVRDLAQLCAGGYDCFHGRQGCKPAKR